MDENRIYTTVQGDMWDSIAYQFYGDVKYIGLLLQSNTDLLEIYVFSAGTKVYIPKLPEEDETDVPEWRL
mgnify:FL=1